MRLLACVLLTVLMVSGATPARAEGATPARAEGVVADRLEVGGLTAEHEADPLGIDTATPRLGWQLASKVPGARQSAYEIVVSRGSARVWDSGKVRSTRSFDVEYAGPALESRTRYQWRVRAWD